MTPPKKMFSPNSIPVENTFADTTSVRILRMADIIHRIANSTLGGQSGLRMTDLRILVTLESSIPLTVSEIARRTYVDKAWISRSLNDLEEKRLIKRTADKNDSRCTNIQLTKKGMNLLEKVRPTIRVNEEKMLVGLNIKSFKRELDRLYSNLEQHLEELNQAQ